MKVSLIDVAGALVTRGEFTPFLALSKLYSRAEFRTSVTPTISVDVAALDAQEDSGGPGWAMSLIRPTLTLTGPEGTKIIAPAGEAGQNGALTGMLLAAGLIGIPFLVGVSVGKQPKRRSSR